MASLNEIKKRLKKVSLNDLQSEMANIITDDNTIYQAKINEFQRGITPNGGKIGEYRNVDYAVFKQQLNPLAGGMVDLILTGSFSSALFVDYLGDSKYKFDSLDRKSDALFDKYGQNLRGINQQTFNDLQKKDYAPKLIRFIKRKTNL